MEGVKRGASWARQSEDLAGDCATCRRGFECAGGAARVTFRCRLYRRSCTGTPGSINPDCACTSSISPHGLAMGSRVQWFTKILSRARRVCSASRLICRCSLREVVGEAVHVVNMAETT